MADSPERLLTTKQVAERLQLNPATVQRWLRSGRLRGVILSDAMGWRVPESEVQRLLEAGFAAGAEREGE